MIQHTIILVLVVKVGYIGLLQVTYHRMVGACVSIQTEYIDMTIRDGLVFPFATL